MTIADPKKLAGAFIFGFVLGLIAITLAPPGPLDAGRLRQANAQTGGTVAPLFSVGCNYSHSSTDDPVGNMHHLHDFWGNTTTSNQSTYGSMTKAPTTCAVPSDTAAYWNPAVRINGKRVLPSRKPGNFYYALVGNQDVSEIRPYPPNFKMIANEGNGQLKFYCSDARERKLEAPPGTCRGSLLVIKLVFPSCWDGDHDDVRAPGPEDVREAVTVNGRRKCPASHPVALPELNTGMQYPTSGTIDTVQVAGDSGWQSWRTAHADFWNTWDQPELERLINRCLKNGPYNRRPEECQA